MSYEPQPRRTAEEAASFLRSEIMRCHERLASLQTRRDRVSDRFNAECEAEQDPEVEKRIRARWGEALREKDAEKKVIEAELFAFRKTLQYLTGELWS